MKPISLATHLRSLALELTHASKSDTLDHARVLADAAKSIRHLLKVTPPTRAVIVIEGGLVAGVFSSDAKLNVSILNRDYSEDSATRAEQEAEDAGLEVEIKGLPEVNC